MNSAKYFSLLITIGVTFGCTTIPTQEMSDARQAVQAAREVGATTHAPENLTNAENFLNDAKKALDAGYYDVARKHALAAKAEAIEARKNTLKSDSTPSTNPPNSK